MADFDALGALCALLDRSITQIAEASADARTFDRGVVVKVTDVWDNNTYPLFHAAVGKGPGRRDDRALDALRWMAEFHRDWMVEQAAVAGFGALDDVLPPNPPPTPFRDHLGTVLPRLQPFTTETVEELAADYDLAASQVVHFHVERAGRQLNANLRLTVPRLFPVDAERRLSAPALALGLRDVSALSADGADLRGATLSATDRGIRVSVGTDGLLEAATGHLRITDNAWHLSAAGRRADAVIPPRADKPAAGLPPVATRLSTDAELAAEALRDTMIGIRAVRYSILVDLRAVSDSCQGYAGAGQRLLNASRQRLPFRRNAILRQLIAAGTPPYGSRPAVVDAARPANANAELRMVSYTAAHEQYGQLEEEALLRHFAVPPETKSDRSGPWQIEILQDPEPSSFRIRFEDFQAAEL